MTARHRTSYSRTPRKGTKARNFLLAALRPQGVTHREVVCEIAMKATAVAPTAKLLIDLGGWDLRQFPVERERCAGTGRRLAYRLAGKMRWDGSYRSFINPSKEPSA